MQKVSVTMEVPKESKEIVDALAHIVTEIKMKKSVAEMVGSSLAKLIAAVEGFDQLGEEIKSDGQDEIAGYLVQQVMQAIKVEPAVAAPSA